MNLTNYPILAEQLPNEEIANFYEELIENILHDERSYGPTTFTAVLSSFHVPADNNPKRLYLSVAEHIEEEEEKKTVMHNAFCYFQDIIATHFPHAFINRLKSKDRLIVIQEEDLPF